MNLQRAQSARPVKIKGLKYQFKLIEASCPSAILAEPTSLVEEIVSGFDSPSSIDTSPEVSGVVVVFFSEETSESEPVQARKE